MKKQLLLFNDSVDASFAGKDYPEGKVSPPDPESINWFDAERYQKGSRDGKTTGPTRPT